MEQQNHYRHELKYKITYGDYLALRSRLKTVMRPDIHAGHDGKYLIRSIYFDNYNDKALREKLDGVQKREKFRIRWYDDGFGVIHLEKKMKLNSLCLKLSAALTEAQCRELCQGRTEWMAGHPSELVRELAFKMKSQQLRPRVVVSYVREPFVYAPGNVRITFDTQIRTSLFRRELLEQGSPDMAATDQIVLEVKYDDYLPEIITALLQTEGIRQGAFSKYGVCRRYG